MRVGKKVMLQPNKEQIKDFVRFAGTNRFAWNQSKAFCDNLFKEKREYATLSDLLHHMQDLKHNNPNYAWLNNVPEAITKQSMKDLLNAYKKFYKERKSNYDEKRPNKFLPKFKKRDNCHESFYQRTDGIYKTDDSHIKITGIRKPVKCNQLKGVDLPKHILNPRITFDGKYWYLSYSYDIEEINIVALENDVLGIDLGIKELAVFSNGEHHRNINKDKEIKRLVKRLKHLQRKVARKYEANVVCDCKGKKLYHKTNNIKRLEKQVRLIHRRIVNIRKTYMYEVIKSAMKTKSKTIVLEDLNVNSMMQNPKLAKAIQEEKLSEFRRIITYKCKQNGTELIIADRWYPSSKKCSCCGNKRNDLKLSDRVYRCNVCGLVIDRDENAAINLAKYPKIGSVA